MSGDGCSFHSRPLRMSFAVQWPMLLDVWQQSMLTPQALLNNRLIPLDKNPGVRPIGISESLRPIIGKAIMTVLKKDIMLAAGVTQVCAGHPAGCEAAIHALRDIFQDMDTDAVLLIDADNAFNRLNRTVALHNVQYTCPPLATIALNFYRTPSRLFVTGGMELSSEEGTTQGCPLSMALYALSVIPLINKCRNTATTNCSAATQIWFADDAAAGGQLEALHHFWTLLTQHGPAYGYFPKPSKSFLVVKPGRNANAERVFSGTGVQLTDDAPNLEYKAGQRHLGAAVGSAEYVAAYLDEKVAHWSKQVIQLADVASTEPHAARETFRHQTANTDPDARADIRVRGFWTDSRSAFFDTRVFYPHARSYQSRGLPSLYKKFESEKKREYGERINVVEHGSFTPLVFSACGGMGHEATVVVKRLASALALKRHESYSHVINWLRCRLSFSLARSTIRCVRGSRSIRRRTLPGLAPVDLVSAETQFVLY